MAILRDSGFSGAKATQGVPVACACTLLGKQAPPERFDPRETACHRHAAQPSPPLNRLTWSAERLGRTSKPLL